MGISALTLLCWGGGRGWGNGGPRSLSISPFLGNPVAVLPMGSELGGEEGVPVEGLHDVILLWHERGPLKKKEKNEANYMVVMRSGFL